MNICAACQHGPSSRGTAQHFAPFWCRHRIALSIRRRSYGGVLPNGRHASTNGSKTVYCSSLTIASLTKTPDDRHI
jgi:hypothetical protein